MEALLLLLISFTTFVSSIYGANDTIHVNQSLRDGETIVSSGGIFELGFFNSSSQRRYLGIWYTFSPETVVWVANREVPLNDSSGVLQVTSQGIHVMTSSSNNVAVWSSVRSSGSTRAQNLIAQLLDTGNFVLRDADDTSEDGYLWESFGFGGVEDTSLAGAKVGKNLVTGLEWREVSWKSPSDPSFGDTSRRLETSGYPQFFIEFNGSVVFRTGPWNGYNFGGLRQMRPNPYFSYHLVYTEEEIYMVYEMINNSVFFRIVLDNGGAMHQFLWDNSSRKWETYATLITDDCDKYARCGAFGRCSISTNLSPVCNCLQGFTPRFPKDWASGNWSGGCAREKELVCAAGVTFQRIDGVKVPDASKSWFNRTMDLTECEMLCAQNCSCTAYTTLDMSTGEGCLLWTGDLLDIREYEGNGQFFLLKISTSGPDKSRSFGKNKLRVGLVITSVVSMGILIVGILVYFCNKKHQNQETVIDMQESIFDNKDRKKEVNFQLFDVAAVAHATGGFSKQHILGEGGFGTVYKGALIDGQEIAVKRLSIDSWQGANEFKSEVALIARLQHRNLVRLVGCCIEGNEKMLIYEYMPNRSLDHFIFDHERRKSLDWNTLNFIIIGIARGLLYLHQDSRLRVIHRDLKASNVLLDANMTPKISDFGLARMIGGDQTEAKTLKVSGTYGYMAPEYAIDGRFSMKSDVFSFGVLLLEIISGERNRGFSSKDHSYNLLGHVWKLWTEGRPLELVPETSDDPYPEPEVKRYIHIGLLCVQQQPQDRPSMASVVLMLSSESPLPVPKQPGFYVSRNISDWSLNDMSITLLDAR